MQTNRSVVIASVVAASLALAAACENSPPASEDSDAGNFGGTGGTSSGGVSSSDGSGGIVLASGGGLIVDEDVGGGGGLGGSAATVIEELPSGFTAAEGAIDGSDAADLRGGYELVGPLAELEDSGASECSNVLRVLMRDFRTYGHPAFGVTEGPAEGLVEVELGSDRKPVRTDVLPDTALQFEDWYDNVEGTNVPYVVDLWLEPEGEQFVFDSSRFFPLDSVTTDDDKQPDHDERLRNFGFTTELHTSFEYRGGESFTFRGDDDVFVFVDGKLVVDLGGLHGPLEGTVLIDDLGLTTHEVYDLDLFQAERCPAGSHFRIETTLDFTDCGVIIPDAIVK